MAPRGNYPSETADAFSVRMPDGMRDRLKREAAANQRSMNSEILARIEASFEVAKSLAPELARLIDRHIEQEVSARLRAIAAQIGGS